VQVGDSWQLNLRYRVRASGGFCAALSALFCVSKLKNGPVNISCSDRENGLKIPADPDNLIQLNP